MKNLRSIEDLLNTVNEISFLPLLSNRIVGFSVEDNTPVDVWWTGKAKSDPWEWRKIAAKHPDIAYGKFFDESTGFISKEWFPVFANYRRTVL